MIKILRFTEYLYLLVAIMAAYKIITTWGQPDQPMALMGVRTTSARQQSFLIGLRRTCHYCFADFFRLFFRNGDRLYLLQQDPY